MIDRVIKMFKQVIYYFIAVVEQGSFSKAAKKILSITISNFSANHKIGK